MPNLSTRESAALRGIVRPELRFVLWRTNASLKGHWVFHQGSAVVKIVF